MKRILAALLLFVATPAAAHEVRPAYLDIRELTDNRYDVLWKTPMRGDLRLALEPAFSCATTRVGPPVSRASADATVEQWRVQASSSLRGQSVRIAGLDRTMTDAVVRIEFADGTTWTQRLTPWSPGAVIPVRPSPFATARTYLKFGIEHILLGIDHLLFVTALLFLTRGTSRLIKTITAFTVAHSITLGCATLGLVHVPQQPVEAVIALSIVFVATEIVRANGGRSTLATTSPWIIAFVFGLLHGFGFARALAEIGLPQKQVPVALLFFNIGVEAGQLLFVGTVLGLAGVLRRVFRPVPRMALAPAYLIGSVAMFWVIQRVAGFWSR